MSEDTRETFASRGETTKRQVLLFASYCGKDNPACSPARPCYECLLMCNVFDAEISLDRYVRQLGDPPAKRPRPTATRDRRAAGE